MLYIYRYVTKKTTAPTYHRSDSVRNSVEDAGEDNWIKVQYSALKGHFSFLISSSRGEIRIVSIVDWENCRIQIWTCIIGVGAVEF